MYATVLHYKAIVRGTSRTTEVPLTPGVFVCVAERYLWILRSLGMCNCNCATSKATSQHGSTDSRDAVGDGFPWQHNAAEIRNRYLFWFPKKDTLGDGPVNATSISILALESLSDLTTVERVPLVYT